MPLLALVLALQLVGPPDLSPHFTGIAGTFVLLDGQTGASIRHDPERAVSGTRHARRSKFPTAP
jgi:hypothetical protein